MIKIITDINNNKLIRNNIISNKLSTINEYFIKIPTFFIAEH